jgi:hypothetical protein
VLLVVGNLTLFYTRLLKSLAYRVETGPRFFSKRFEFISRRVRKLEKFLGCVPQKLDQQEMVERVP